MAGMSPLGRASPEATTFLQLANGNQSSSSFLETRGGHRGKELPSPHSLGWDNWDELVTGSQLRAEPGPSEGFGPTCVERTVFDLELGLVLVGNVLPSGQEHLPLCSEERNQRSDEAPTSAAPPKGGTTQGPRCRVALPHRHPLQRLPKNPTRGMVPTLWGIRKLRRLGEETHERQRRQKERRAKLSPAVRS